MRRISSRTADFLPFFVFAVVLGIVFLFDRERSGAADREVEAARVVAERRAGVLADELGNLVSARLGALTGARPHFTTPVEEEAEAAFVAALDSATEGLQGLAGISFIDVSSERIIRAPGTMLGMRLTLADSVIRLPYLRALATRTHAATGAVADGALGRRVFVFDPVVRGDTSRVTGVLVAELDPQAIYRVATASAPLDSIPGGLTSHALFVDGVRISSVQQVPSQWSSLRRHVRVADSEWIVEMSYALPDLRVYRAERIATWSIGLAIGLAVGLILHIVRQTIRRQREEIERRQAAEEAARTAASEARARARQARELAAQLEAAQRASQQLSTSLDPDDVVELFLGGVAEILSADVASLYTFEEEGELLVGRRRMVFREIDEVTRRLKQEDIREVRAPVSLLPMLAEAVSTGEPFVVENRTAGSRLLGVPALGSEAPTASLAVPLMIAGHTVGVASWDVYAEPRRFADAHITFAQALAAPAAAALRTAELFASLEAERRRAAREAVRFGAVLDQMADGVVVVDAAGRLERWNAAAGELLSEDLADTRVEEWPARFDLATSDGRPLAPDDFVLMRAMRGERVRRANFIVRSDWGTERHLSAFAGPILDGGGVPAGAAMVLRDMTDEHQYAEMLRHTNRELRRQTDVLEQVNRQLRDATRAKDQFLAVMSHELRTPINAIMGYSDLLDLGVKGPLNQEQRAMLGRLRETSRHLLGLINEVLDLAKIGAGRMDMVLAEVDANAVVDSAAQQILPLAAAKGLDLEVARPRRAGVVVVRADETRLKQIIVNLLSNAVKFTVEGCVSVAVEEHGDVVEIHVRDTGPGIPPAELDRIFDEFYQVEGGLARSAGGTGLGLSISRRFARLMGGDVQVSSELNRGSTFTVRLPVVDTPDRQEDADVHQVVMLVHDTAVLDGLGEDLDGSVRLVGATDAAQFAARVRRVRPQVVAIDARVPDCGAWRALGALQADPHSARLPAALFARHADDVSTAIDLGLVHVLAKPISVECAREVALRAAGGREATDGLTVLIADDDADVRRILGEGLRAAGCDIRVASSGGELLDLARRVQPDVAVVDLLMPGMDGIEAIAAMRSEPSLARIGLVVVLSRELAPFEIAQFEASVEALGRGRRSRIRATADLLRDVLETDGIGVARRVVA